LVLLADLVGFGALVQGEGGAIRSRSFCLQIWSGSARWCKENRVQP